MAHPDKNPQLRLRRLKIQNYKRLDELEVAFPKPQLTGDPDIFVLGSENGGGKTSVLECIGLLFLCTYAGTRMNRLLAESEWLMELSDFFIKSGEKECTISGEFEVNEKSRNIRVNITRQNGIQVSGDIEILSKHRRRKQVDDLDFSDDALMKLLGITGEPLILPSLLHFNSSRKVQEGSIDLSALTEGSSIRRMNPLRGRMSRPISTISAFKTEMLSSLLGRASLFEDSNASQSRATAEKLNELLLRYAGGKIEQLRNVKGTIDFRVQRHDSAASFTFDALSSGQKEIVSTLFLIWRHATEDSTIVLIDEPELHLNAEWHADFVQQLARLAPTTQYILATHSEHIFGSVDEDHRALLIPHPSASKT